MNEDWKFGDETYQIIGAAMEVHTRLGCGFVEHVYQDALEIEFITRNIPYEREKHMNIFYRGVPLKHDFYADFVCHGSIIVELKAVKELLAEHEAQVLNYLNISDYSVGLLFNFSKRSLEYQRFIR